MQRNKNQPRNQLWLARKRIGLGQKHVAYLLNHQTTHQISRYEQGQRIPGLKLLLQFEIIYGLPARVLYRDIYDELRAAIERRAQSTKLINTVYTPGPEGATLLTEFCSHEELMRDPSPTQAEQDRARKHVLLLMNRISHLQPKSTL